MVNQISASDVIHLAACRLEQDCFSVTNPDLHLVMLMAKLGFIAAQTSVMRIAACWKGIDLVGAVWLGQFYDMGGIMGGQRTVLMQGNLNTRRYIVDVLRRHVIPFLHNQGPGVTFQHDNSRPHTALITGQFLAQNNVDVFPWPAVSPDLNLVEYVWGELDG